MEELLGQPSAFRASSAFAGVIGQVTNTNGSPLGKTLLWSELYANRSCLSSAKRPEELSGFPCFHGTAHFAGVHPCHQMLAPKPHPFNLRQAIFGG
jgi:hypothetical protein